MIVSPVNWRSDVPTPGAGETLFIARTTVNPATQSGNITPTWSTPFEAGGDGPAGPAGPIGPAGAAGAAGAAGLNGDPGPAGQDGDDGSTGPTGQAGQTGAAGADGADGADGQDGTDGGGGGLTAAAIAALSAGATNSNTELPSAHEGDLGKISIANIHAYMESSVGLGPRINPGPSLAAAGQVPAVNAAGDAYELTTVDGGTVTVIAGPVDAAASLSGQLQYNPGSKDVEVCINDGHVTVAPVGTWDYIPFNADFSIVQTRGSVLLPVVGQYIYDEGNDEFYNWVVVGTDILGNFVLGWRRVNPSTALSFARRTGTGIVVYWLGGSG